MINSWVMEDWKVWLLVLSVSGVAGFILWMMLSEWLCVRRERRRDVKRHRVEVEKLKEEVESIYSNVIKHDGDVRALRERVKELEECEARRKDRETPTTVRIWRALRDRET